jgi:hypothetical protein
MVADSVGVIVVVTVIVHLAIVVRVLRTIGVHVEAAHG